MKAGEVIRATCITLFGAFLLFLMLPWLYQYTFLTPLDVEVEEWISEKYLIGATIVFVVTVISQLIWFAIAVRYRGDEKDVEAKLVYWWGLLILSLVSIAISIYICCMSSGGSGEVFPSLILFFLVAVAVIYWLTTATSTPGALMFIVPKSLDIRNIFKS